MAKTEAELRCGAACRVQQPRPRPRRGCLSPPVSPRASRSAGERRPGARHEGAGGVITDRAASRLVEPARQRGPACRSIVWIGPKHGGGTDSRSSADALGRVRRWRRRIAAPSTMQSRGEASRSMDRVATGVDLLRSRRRSCQIAMSAFDGPRDGRAVSFRWASTPGAGSACSSRRTSPPHPHWWRREECRCTRQCVALSTRGSRRTYMVAKDFAATISTCRGPSRSSPSPSEPGSSGIVAGAQGVRTGRRVPRQHRGSGGHR